MHTCVYGVRTNEMCWNCLESILLKYDSISLVFTSQIKGDALLPLQGVPKKGKLLKYPNKVKRQNV